MFLAAVIQLNCTSDAQANWRVAEDLIRRAAKAGATFIATPENANYLGPHDEKVRLAEPLDGPTVSRFARLAELLQVYILIGSVNERSRDPHRCYNTSVLLAPDGTISAFYRKIHLFDVDVSPEVRFLESDTTVAGDEAMTVDTPLCTIGMSICYDLRFPELYRKLVDAGATVLTVPSAFTATTGKDHWEVLLRARAVETQSYVIAPGQHGEHDDGGLRNSYGHSMIVDPWGHVIARASDGPGLALAEIDPGRVRTIRQGMPIATHRRLEH
jgi:deaminated glutathione amidase